MRHPTHYKRAENEVLMTWYKTSDDLHALGELLSRHSTLLIGIAYNFLEDEQAAEDAVQSTMIKALENLPKEDLVNFKGWLYTVLKNECFQIIKKRKIVTLFEDIVSEEKENFIDKSELYRQEYWKEIVQSELDQLPIAQRKCLELFYLKNYRYDDIIQETGYSYNEVKSYIQNGKRNLKNSLIKLGYQK